MDVRKRHIITSEACHSCVFHEYTVLDLLWFNERFINHKFPLIPVVFTSTVHCNAVIYTTHLHAYTCSPSLWNWQQLCTIFFCHLFIYIYLILVISSSLFLTTAASSNPVPIEFHCSRDFSFQDFAGTFLVTLHWTIPDHPAMQNAIHRFEVKRYMETNSTAEREGMGSNVKIPLQVGHTCLYMYVVVYTRVKVTHKIMLTSL